MKKQNLPQKYARSATVPSAGAKNGKKYGMRSNIAQKNVRAYGINKKMSPENDSFIDVAKDKILEAQLHKHY